MEWSIFTQTKECRAEHHTRSKNRLMQKKLNTLI